MANRILKELYTASLESEDDLHPEAKNKADDASGKGKPEVVIDVETVDETYKEGKVPKEDVEVAEKTRDSMEAVLAAVESSLEDGGLGKSALALARVSVEGLAEVMGVKPELIMTFEGFDESDEELDREEATKASLESMRPTVEHITALATTLRERMDTGEGE
jgi:hypothetical protein